VYGDAFIMRWSVKFYVANFDVVYVDFIRFLAF